MRRYCLCRCELLAEFVSRILRIASLAVKDVAVFDLDFVVFHIVDIFR